MNPLLAAESIRSSSTSGQVVATHLHVRPPLRLADGGWTSPLGWTPGWFHPYVHQAAAFERLGTAGSFARPTVLVGGRGSGRTEAYLYPVLDHSLRQHKNSRPGLKALIVCSTEGVAREHAARTAGVIGWDPTLRGVTVGCHLGADGADGTAHAPIVVGEVTVPLDATTLGATPPDILFTAPNHLGSLLFDPDLRGLWKATTRESLRYIVVEDLQTYDDRATSVLAMSLRRLGAKLHIRSSPTSPPLGGAALVATVTTSTVTSAAPPELIEDVLSLASRVFGVQLGPDSLLLEDRHTAAELATVADRSALVPTPVELATIDADDTTAIAASLGLAEVVDDPVVLGSHLGVHPLTCAVVEAASERPVELGAVLDVIGRSVAGWQEAATAGGRDPATQALARFLSLVGIARRRVGGFEVPLVDQQVHVWVRSGDGRSSPAAMTEVIGAMWTNGRVRDRDRRTLVLCDSPQTASHGAAVLRRILSPPPGEPSPSVLAREVTPSTPPAARAAVASAFDAAHPEAPLVLLATPGPDLGVDVGGLVTTVLVGAAPTTAAYRARIGRLGRDRGMSLVVTILGDSPTDRAAAATCGAVVAGQAELPSCRVEDTDLLRRFFVAEVIDHLSATDQLRLPTSSPMEVAVRGAFDAESTLRRIIEAAADDDVVSSFVGSLGVGVVPIDVEADRDPSAPSAPGTLFGRPITTGTGTGALSVNPESPVEPTSTPQPPGVASPGAGNDTDHGGGGSPSGVLPPLGALPPLGSAQPLAAPTAAAVSLVSREELLDDIGDFARHGVEPVLRDAVQRWRESILVLRARHRRVTASLRAAGAQPADPVEVDQLWREAALVADAVRERRLQPWTDALADLGVLPRTTGTCDGVELRAALWSSSPGTAPLRLHQCPSGSTSSQDRTMVAPGDVVDAEDHRILVDGVELDGRGDAAYEVRLVCGRCGWLTPPGADGADPSSACRRCSASLADATRRWVLRPGTVIAEGAEESARDAGSDVPVPAQGSVDVDAGIDVDASAVAAAWRLASVPFGAELLDGAMQRRWAGPVTLCRHCGVAHGVRAVPEGRSGWMHRSWCDARSDPANAVWDEVELLREHPVDAMRVLVPVSRFDASSRVGGFEVVIRAGLRQLGQRVDLLGFTRSAAPAPHGGVHNYLVIHSLIPPGGDDGVRHEAQGGAHDERHGSGPALLHWLVEPPNLRSVLDAGRRVLRSVPGLVAASTLRLVDEVLDHDDHPVAVERLAVVDLSAVEHRELCDTFVDTLRGWAHHDDHAVLRGIDAAAGSDDGRAASAAADGDAPFALSLTLESNRHDYRVDRTTTTLSGPTDGGVGPAGEPVADFWIRSLGGTLPPVGVVVCSGDPSTWQGLDRELSADDVQRVIRWNISGADIMRFAGAVRSGQAMDSAGVGLFDDAVRDAADRMQQAQGGVFSAAAVAQNPMALLLDLLARPNLGEWHRVAAAVRSAAEGGSTAGPMVQSESRTAWSNIIGLTRN